QAVAQRRAAGLVGDDRVVRAVRAAQGAQCVDLAARRQHAGAHPPAMARDHVQRGGADRTGGAEDRDPAHLQNPNQAMPRANTGSAASTLARRSSTPPWPGMRWLESFTPTWRLSRLSNRSPVIENATVSAATSSTAGSCAAVAPASGAPASATSSASATPPSAPSMVLLGLIRGASRRPP